MDGVIQTFYYVYLLVTPNVRCINTGGLKHIFKHTHDSQMLFALCFMEESQEWANRMQVNISRVVKDKFCVEL